MFKKNKKYISTFATEWWNFISIPYNFFNVIVSLFFLEASYVTTKYFAIIATKNASNTVTDIVFTNFSKIDTSFVHGTITFFMFDLRLLLFVVFIRYTSFAAKVLGVLIFFRAFTINLTNLGMPEGIVPIASQMTYGGDLFFSGHVANTFMLGLIFWEIKPLRYLFIAVSIIFGISAVLGRYHYSIDVISAPFFAYGIYILGKKLFKADYKLINSKVIQ